jgi:hypothetical protein
MAVGDMVTPPAAQPATGARKWLAFGTGVGVAIAGSTLRVAAVRVRPSGARLLGYTSIHDYPQRPATDWGAEYAAFARRAGVERVPAIVLLPRHDVTVRSLTMPGVDQKDLSAAISYQIDSLHPYAEHEAAWSWSRLPGTPHVLVGITRRETVDSYANLFSESGVRLAGFSFSAAALYSASRVLVKPARGGVLAFSADDAEPVEAYGESDSRPVFSGLFDQHSERLRQLALSELRLDPDGAAASFADLLPPVAAPEAFPRSEYALALAAAISGASPRLALAVNLLPEERRTQSSPLIYAPTAVLGLLMIGAAVAMSYQQSFHDNEYLGKLNEEIRRLERQASAVAALDGQIQSIEQRIELLDQHRQRSKADADALREITTLVAPPAWVSSLQLSRRDAFLSGEAEQATGLLKLIDGSPLFKESSFSQAMTKVGGGEQFTMRTFREGPGTGSAPGETR